MRGHFVLFFPRSKMSIMLSLVALIALLSTLVVTGVVRVHPAGAQTSDSWLTYGYTDSRSNYNPTETIINPATAHNLNLKWTATSTGCTGSPGGPVDIFSQPIVDQNLQMIFWGSWDGCEHATNLSGQQVWSTFLGQIVSPNCNFPSTLGVSSTATDTTLTINGVSTPVILVGGGDGNFYALNAQTGAIIWQTQLGVGTGSYLWASPAVYNGDVYEGLSSQLDCPLVQSKFYQLDATTGTILNTFNIVPSGGCTGGSVWGSPAIDETAGTVYFATGNPGKCAPTETLAPALVELSLSNLSLIGSWQVPKTQQVPDSDFGDTPTLFQATINGVSTPMVGVMNKNGKYYAFVRDNLGNGPVWTATISSNPGGQPNDSPSAFDGTNLYVGGSNATVSGTVCTGKGSSLQALNPATGAFLWQKCLLGVCCVWGAVTAVPGLVVAAGFNTLRVVSMSTQRVLFSYTDKITHALFYGPSSISNGMLFIGDSDGNLYAFGI
jgi:outer membrane protein assembly factor BamB